MNNLSKLKSKLPGTRMINILNYLENIADSVELIENEKHFPDLYEYKITIKKDNYSKTFQVDISSSYIHHVIIDNRVIRSNLEISMALLSIADEIFLIKNPSIKSILNYLRCPNNICPICDSKLNKKIVNEESNHYVLMCTNKCYATDVYNLIENKDNMVIDIYIFEDMNFDTYAKTKDIEDFEKQQEQRSQKIYEAYKMINYWKENNRYLTKLLRGD